MVSPGPFVKWAGGKAQIVEVLLEHTPNSFERYLEPFVGGGALLFKLLHPRSYINDSNAELINCYRVIKCKVYELIDSLKKHENEKKYYYEVRRQSPEDLTDVERASRLIYLNRTCYNGLWRVNKKGQFNTPFGNYKNPKIVNEKLLLVDSNALRNVELFCMDFEDFLMTCAEPDDYIYLDPPYHPISKYSDFKRYTRDFFDINDQVRLSKVFKELDRKGCKLLLSNSECHLIRELYKDFKIDVIRARRNINKDPEGRKGVNELIIRNFD